MQEKIGIFGGTFDPVHLGHCRLGQAFLEELALDRVFWVPVGLPAHRAAPQFSSEDRLTFLRKITESEPRFIVDDRELRRQKIAYTVETLEEFRAEFANAALYFLLGSDAFFHFQTWHRWQDILSLTNLVIATRPDFEFANMPPELFKFWQEHQQKTLAKPSLAGKILSLSLVPADISSTQIRAQIAAGDIQNTALPESIKPLISAKKS